MSPLMLNRSKARVLIVEDEPDIAGLMKHALERSGDFDVEIVGTGSAALKSMMEDPPGLVLLDLNLPFKIYPLAGLQAPDFRLQGKAQSPEPGARSPEPGAYRIRNSPSIPAAADAHRRWS
jgi:CheY-like chemotaxis protein